MIYCFTGTGNSLWVAQRLADTLHDDITLINNPSPHSRLPRDKKCHTDSDCCDRPVIWVFPIYSWGLPPIVKRFMSEHLSHWSTGHTPHYMVCTCGDDIGLAHKQWRKIIEKHKCLPHSTFSVQMPNTYTLMKGFDVDSPQTARQKLADAHARVDYISLQINQGTTHPATDDVVTGRWAWIKTRIIYPYFMRFCMSPKPFHATDACIACGICAHECPLQNITIHSKRLQWGNDCTMCLRCYHTCPRHAVAYGKATINKGQYLHP